MSDNQNTGFGKFVPGFDFLQNLAKGASQSMPQMPNLSNWVAPTLNLEELEKRIGELKAVHFWLDQNSKALAATVQALEVQKMTLATLKGMNFNMGEVAEALKLKPGAGIFGAGTVTDKGASPAGDTAAPGAPPKAAAKAGGAAKPASGLVDPLQWWGAVTQQFQQIAADAMKDAAPPATVKAAANPGAGEGASVKAPAKTKASTKAAPAAPAARKTGAKRAATKTRR
jgi:hypothetical protein